MHVVGVDGTKGGWVAIGLDSDGCLAGDALLRPVETSFRELATAQVIGIDVPIGFGPRTADATARAYLRGAASTVFTTLSREILKAPYAPGRGVSKQSHGLGPRIMHLAEIARTDARFYEVHPEVSFRAMNDGSPLRFRKKSWGGARERVELLRRSGINLTGVDAAAAAPTDDVLDAAAAAWSAHRIDRGEARTLPDPPELIDGRLVAIWY